VTDEGMEGQTTGQTENMMSPASLDWRKHKHCNAISAAISSYFVDDTRIRPATVKLPPTATQQNVNVKSYLL